MNIINAYNANAACIMAVYITYFRLNSHCSSIKISQEQSPLKYFFPWSMISLKLIISPNNLRTNNSKIIGEKTQQTELFLIAQQLLNEH